ncbi:sigma-54-dependent response regulator transcription factor ZraR [soil metagenome]
MSARILLVDDDHVFRVTTAALLRDDGYDVALATGGQDAVEQLQRQRFDLLILDLRMPGTSGIGVVEALRRWGEGMPILMISGFGTVADAVDALHTGADDFLTKPVDPAVLSDRVASLLERRPAPPDAGQAGGLIGRSPAIQSVKAAIELVAPTEATVLITGETGTGKELVARAVHEASRRRAAPFVAVNCAALAEGLLESELFGHVRGAFTGALRDRTGLFQTATGGTILLDEIGDIAPAMQQRLLRVLQERELTPVGGDRVVNVDVRVVAATNRDLRQEVTAGRFREDLYYRLRVFPIEVPPLRARGTDIPLLVRHFFARSGGSDDDGGSSCSPFAMRLLQSYAWPGNVRELFAVLESASIRAAGSRIEAQHLPPEIRLGSADAAAPSQRYSAGTTADEERAIRAALDEANGSRVRAAELLGMGRTTLWRKMKEYGIDVADDGIEA